MSREDVLRARAGIVRIAYELGSAVADELDVTLWEVEYLFEADTNILRFVLDRKGEKIVDLDLCETYSRAVEVVLDRVDPIEESYCLEVSSAGIGRTLTRPFHFRACAGKRVEVSLYRTLGESDIANAALLQFDVCDKPIVVDCKRFEATLRGVAEHPAGDRVLLTDDAGLDFTMPTADAKRIALAVVWSASPKGRGKR